MTWTILDLTEISIAFGTILLSIVTVWNTVHQNKKAKLDKIENWKDSYLTSHYEEVMEEIKEIQNEISPFDEPWVGIRQADFGFERLYTRRNRWRISKESLLISDDNILEVKCLIDKNNTALQHINSGYRQLSIKIRAINSREDRYEKYVKGNLQNLIDYTHQECKSEFGEWNVKPNVYTPVEKVGRVVLPESTKENTPVIKEIYVAPLADFLVESIIKEATDLRAEKEFWGTEVDSFNISLTFKTDNFVEFEKPYKGVARTQNYNVTDEDLLKFRKVGIKLKTEANEIKNIHEERERIMEEYKELRERLTVDILNKYEAGYRIMGECNICKLTKDAKIEEIRPYVN